LGSATQTKTQELNVKCKMLMVGGARAQTINVLQFNSLFIYWLGGRARHPTKINN
tara:strand:- start:372 stop:536 length:165 start_codon:yes stop_codon:yes gene_type:complete